MIHEINSHDWPAFCQQVNEQCRGAMVKLETIGRDGLKVERAANAAFEGMTFDASDGCSDVITLRLDGAREIVHEIIEPIQMTLQGSGAAGDLNPLQIEAESGITIATFHPAIRTELLKGLKAR